MSFIFNPNLETPEQIAQARAIAAALRQQKQPVNTAFGAIGSILGDIGGFMGDRKANRAESEGASKGAALFHSLLGGGTTGQEPVQQTNASPSQTGSTGPGNMFPPTGGNGDAVASIIANKMAAAGYKPHQIAGALGNLKQESGFNTGALGDHSIPGGSFGIGQWNRERQDALKSYAKSKGTSLDNAEMQADFFLHELETTESRAGQALRNSQNVDEATAAMIGYERPAGWTRQNPRAGHGWNNRLAYANSFANSGVLGRFNEMRGVGIGRASAQPASHTTAVDPIMAAMSDPAYAFMTPEQKALLSGILEDRMKRQAQQNDPVYQMQMQQAQQGLEKGQIEIDQLRNPQMSPYEQAQIRVREQEQNNPQVLGEGSRVFDPKTRSIIVDAPPREKPKPAEIAEYEYAKEQGFTGSFMDYKASQKGGMRVDVGPDGNVTFQQGGNIKPMTESQSKDTVYATRAEGALDVFDPIAKSLTEYQGATIGQFPYVGNQLKGENYQKAEQAGNEFLQAVLRKDTGAAITAGEQALYGATYLPQPGDTSAVLDQKKASRRRALAGIKAGMTPQAILAQENALAKTDASQAQPAPMPKKPLSLIDHIGRGKKRSEADILKQYGVE